MFRRPILKISTDVQYVQVLITYELEKSQGGGVGCPILPGRDWGITVPENMRTCLLM